MAIPAADLGARLRAAREQRGLTLRDVAQVTKIPKPLLEAIERNDFDGLPGGLFRRAYVRAFAAEVGIDPEPLPEALRPAPDSWTVDPGPDRLGWLRRHAATYVAVALLLAIFLLARGVWGGRERVEDEVPVPAPAATDASPKAATIASAAAPAPAGREDVGRSRARVELRFGALCWVSAVADGRRVVYRLVAPGEELAIEAHDAITLSVGNAGGVEASINGAPSRVLGQPGEVLTMRVTPRVHEAGSDTDA